MSEKKIFNKLVRDRIPEIIESNGEIPEIEILDDTEYARMLQEKLFEESNELLNANDVNIKVEELADVLEVVHAIADVLEVTMEEIESVRLSKQEKRGAFKNKILLKSTISKDDREEEENVK